MSRWMALVLSLACAPGLAWAAQKPDAFSLLGRLGVAARMHRTLSMYQRMRSSLDADRSDRRVDLMALGMLTNHGGVQEGQQLSLNQTGLLIGVDRLAGDWGRALFRSAAHDTARRLNDRGDTLAESGAQFTVMGAQVWFRDLAAVALGYIGAPTLTGQGTPAFPADAAGASPLFLRLEVPRYGAWARLDLLGAGGLGDSAFGLETGPLWEDWSVELEGRRFAVGGDAWLRGRALWRWHRIAQATSLLGFDLTDGVPNQASLGVRLRVNPSNLIDLGMSMDLGAARVYVNEVDPDAVWRESVGFEMHARINHENVSVGFELGGGVNWSHPYTLAPILEGTHGVFAGAHLRVGI